MPRETYICEVCKRKFPKDPNWDDNKAMEELTANYPGTPVEECGITCDGCHQMIRRMFHG